MDPYGQYYMMRFYLSFASTENPIDSHFNFHALTVTQICLQQIKSSVLADITDFSGNHKPFSEDVINRILRIIWCYLEDP
jgi:thyroid adenoma-associated protein